MKQRLELTGPVFSATLAGALLLASCATRKETQPIGNAPGPVYETAAEIQAMPPCKAVVVQQVPCAVYLRMADGKGFYIGSPGSHAEVGRFVGLLKERRTYRFPEAFLKYQRQRPGQNRDPH